MRKQLAAGKQGPVHILLLAVLILAGCAQAGGKPVETEPGPTDRMELRYADQFTVEYDAAGCALVTIGDTDRFLLVPDGTEAPEDSSMTVLRTPLKKLYVASSSVMDPLSRLDALDAVRLTGTKQEDWTLPAVRSRMEAGELLYAGKYAAPDYELLLSEGTDLAVENTMIFHSPETKEQLEALGIPVLTERSSYESHPLGRLEWIKLFGLLTGRMAEAEVFFNEQAALAEQVFVQENTGKTASFFYISANRRAGQSGRTSRKRRMAFGFPGCPERRRLVYGGGHVPAKLRHRRDD